MQVESKFFQLMRKFILLIIGISLLHGCQFFEKRKTDGVVAEYNGKTLTTRELDALTANLSGEDSARVAQAYIKQWAIEVIEYNIAKDQINNDIEQLVEDYRRSLYLHEYENKLIAQRMPTEIEDTLVQSFYEFHKEHLILPETILRGVLVVVPSDAPNMDDLRTNIQQPEVEENIEWLEKFAYQYATGYELFLEDWKSLSEIIVYMPFEQSNLEKELKKIGQIELQDSIHTYLLQVTDIHPQGTLMPMTYARNEIEQVLLRQRQVEFIQQEREALYNQAIKKRKLILYEK